eukprot:TRINITY_DN4458_c0_g1_i1.p1 TRINITY_DN4458_c0_g1~~TRINITY_DN4458_c0_g1_i1.p1  ORF type:complete len:312 (+),score=41.29 TRINITY_DN4458_c0_g1_i1:122-937(+)
MLYAVGAAFPHWDTYLALIPSYAVGAGYLWTLLTFFLYHGHAHDLLFSVVFLYVFGSYAEKVWGRIEYCKFIAIAVAATGVGSLLTHLLIFMLWQDYFVLYEPVRGFQGVAMALITANKQLRADYSVSWLPVLRVKHLPLLLVAVSLARSILAWNWTNFSMSMFGWLSSWVYLRWFQPHGDGLQGDNTDEFNFSYFFPETLQPGVLSATRTMRTLCCFWVPKKSSSSAPRPLTSIVSVLDAPGDVDRRRALALQALDDRLGPASGPSPLPT